MADHRPIHAIRGGVFISVAVLGLLLGLLVTPSSTTADAPRPTADADAPWARPYDETADAAGDVEHAIERANASGKLLLINFGANWCPDCREFERASLDPDIRSIIDDRFVVAKVDVGNWDKHPDVVAAWDNPIEGGIPAVVVATPDRRILFSTRAGQLSKARHMGKQTLIRFFEYLAALEP